MSLRYTTRLATLSDGIFLREMVYHAAVGVGRARPDRSEVLASEAATAFVASWGRPGDHGVVAQAEGAPVGAAWFRIFEEGDPAGGFVGGETPEMLIALVPAHRGRGVGGLLLSALIARARAEGMPGVGLNVPRANLPAVSLFRRHGFVVVRDNDAVLTMQLAFETG